MSVRSLVGGGDLASASVGMAFRLVYLLLNTITNLTAQDERMPA
jgi:hypothetical protein